MITKGYGRIALLFSLVVLYDLTTYSASPSRTDFSNQVGSHRMGKIRSMRQCDCSWSFCTDLNAAPLDGIERCREFLLRTPMRPFGKLDGPAGAAILLASDAASFVTRHLLALDGGFLASGVNQ